jgi:hypothetical protein
MIAGITRSRAIPIALAALVWLPACSWDGPGVQVVGPTTSQPSPADSSVDVAADPPTSMAEAALPEGHGDEAVPPDLGSAPGNTVVPGGRRPLPADLPDSVAVVGDSLTLAASDEIRSALSGIGIEVVAIDGAENRRMTHGVTPAPGLDSITTIASSAAPALWVVALGTNDIGAASDLDNYTGDVRRLLDEIPQEAAVVWVDVWIRDRQPAVERANAELRSVLAERPRSMVADWFSHGDDDGVVTTDGVHLTGDGRRVFAATIVDAVLALSA